MRRGGPPQRVGAFLTPVLRKLGIDGRLAEGRGLAAWREAVGEPIARRTETLGVRSGVLWVAVDSSSWMQELAARRREILARLAEFAGRGAIQDVRFVIKGTPEMAVAARRLQQTSGEGDHGEEGW